MVNRLLVLTRKHEISLIPMDINTALRNVMQICANSFDKSITLHPEYSDGAAMIEGVPAQIEQVMLNLCVNASHAMTMMRAENEKRGGALTVSVKKIRADRLFCKTHPKARMINYWLVSHADTGAGIDRQNLNKIFDPFFTTKEKGTGTGLGLAMAYNIIHQHNGFIDVYSEKGMGSTFNIYLPEYMVTDPSQEQHGEDQEIIRGRGLILIVDDESVVRLIARDILTECGYDVLMAEDGRRGIELFRENQDLISAVLLDMAMPGMSGDEVLIELRKIQTDVKVLLTSGFRQDSRMEKALSLGNAVFIQKPYSIYEMSRKIKEITDMTG
jgi:CheY-like chemotaxis protein